MKLDQISNSILSDLVNWVSTRGEGGLKATNPKITKANNVPVQDIDPDEALDDIDKSHISHTPKMADNNYFPGKSQTR